MQMLPDDTITYVEIGAGGAVKQYTVPKDTISGSMMNMDMDGMMYETEQSVSKTDKLMSSWFFVGGITAAVLALGILSGFLCARRKIKKGIDLYED